MTKYILYLIATIFLTQNLNGQNDSKYILDRTKAESLFFIDNTKSFILNYFDLQEDGLDWLTIGSEIIEADYKKLNEKFNTFLNELSHNDQIEIKKKIDTWYKIAILINFPYDLDETELMETLEIISELEQTKKYVDQFITEDGQYWGSLASGQATQVYYEMMEHIFLMSDKEKLKFFRDYYNLAYEKGK